jgi:hypothetical protein
VSSWVSPGEAGVQDEPCGQLSPDHPERPGENHPQDEGETAEPIQGGSATRGTPECAERQQGTQKVLLSSLE